MYPNLNLQSQPIIIWWGIYLNTAVDYRKNFDETKSVIDIFDQNEAIPIYNNNNMINGYYVVIG